MKRIALITGATSGIGKATAEALASHFALILCGRRQEQLDALQESLSSITAVHTLCFDVRDKVAVSAAITGLPPDWQHIEVLINNAGNAHGLAPIQDGDLDDWDAMLDTNVKGLLYVSKAVIPAMVTAQQGHIINIGSIAGKEVYPKGNVYCASKFAVDALSRAMRLDLNAYGIRVGAINPGLVETEFSLVRFKGDSQKAASVYANSNPLQARDIAETIVFVLNRPPHVNISELTILPTDQASATLVRRH